MAQLFDPKNIILKQSAKLRLFLFQVFRSFFSFSFFFRSKMAVHDSWWVSVRIKEWSVTTSKSSFWSSYEIYKSFPPTHPPHLWGEFQVVVKIWFRKDIQDYKFYSRTNIFGTRGFFLPPAGCFGARCETWETAYGNFPMIHDDLLMRSWWLSVSIKEWSSTTS